MKLGSSVFLCSGDYDKSFSLNNVPHKHSHLLPGCLPGHSVYYKYRIHEINTASYNYRKVYFENVIYRECTQGPPHLSSRILTDTEDAKGYYALIISLLKIPQPVNVLNSL